MEFQELLKRRTIRKFAQREIARSVLAKLIDSARVASCASNKQRLRYTMIRTRAKVAEILPFTSYAGLVKPHRNPVAGETSPMAFIMVSGTVEPEPNLYADAGAAIQSIEFAAWAKGIGCCWLGSFQREEVARITGKEPGKILYLIALGYPAEKPVAEDIDREGSPKYYLDENDVLHVPKYTAEAITDWL